VLLLSTNKTRFPTYGPAYAKLDTLKILLLILWETRSIDTKKYELLSIPIEEIGRMLGGWLGQTEKQNSPAT